MAKSKFWQQFSLFWKGVELYCKEQEALQDYEARNADGPVGLSARTLNGLDFQGGMRVGTSKVGDGTGFSLGSGQS